MTEPTKRERPWGQVYGRADASGFTVDFWHEGRRYRRAAGTSWAAADKKRRQARVLLEAGVLVPEVLARVFGDLHGSSLTFSKAAELYLEHGCTRTGRPKRATSLADDTVRLRLLRRAPWAGKVLARITRADLDAWVVTRSAARTYQRKRKRRPCETAEQYAAARDTMETVERPGPSRATIAKDLFLVSALFVWARKGGYVDGNPVHGMEDLREKGKARGVYLTAGESGALVAATPPSLRPFILAAVHTGMRRGELLALEWRDVDLARQEIVIRPETEKAARGRTVPLTKALHATLKGAKDARAKPALDGSDPVFVLADGERLTPAVVRRGFALLRKRCEGIPLAKRNALRLHDLRHTAASLMVGAGVPLFDVAKILGHSTLAVTMRYAHFAPEAARAAIRKLGEALKATPKQKTRKLRRTA